MKKVSIPLLSLCLLLPISVGAQQSFLKDSIKLVQGELVQWEKDLKAACDGLEAGNKKDYSFSSLDRYLERNKDFLLAHEEFDCSCERIDQLRNEIGKRIESIIENEKNQEELVKCKEGLEAICQKYTALMKQFNTLDQLKRNARSDTLAKIKKVDGELFNEYTAKKTQYGESASQPPLDSLCKYIDNSHHAISEAPEIEKIKWGNIIFQVTIVAALLFFVINLIVSKKKLKNQMGGKAKKKKDIPTL